MLVKHRCTKERLAMKIIAAKDFAERPEKYKNEINLQAQMRSCSNIVHYKEYFVAKDLHCIVMEYMPAGDLQKQL